jgi:putative alpha-1,2-mannosidase
VSGNYVFGTPLIDRAEVELGNNNKLRIEVKRGSPGDAYIQSVTLNGKSHQKLWFQHSYIADGAVLEFTMGPQPSTQFGSGEDAVPPSLTN